MHPIKHFKVITKHRHKVIYHCMKAGIFWQGLRHDLSKYSPSEFIPGAKYFTGTKSPNESERRDIGYSKAWMHHQGRNKHHFEYWRDYNHEKRIIMPVKMPYRYVAEMFCDRVAASKIYQGDNYTINHPLEYYSRAKTTRFIHPETAAFLESLLVMLSEEGEDKTFRYIRKLIKENNDY